MLTLFHFSKHKPWVIDPIEEPAAATSSSKSSVKSSDITESSQAASTAAAEEKKLEKKLEKQPVEKQWNLLGPYMGQYIVYTGPNSAWLLSYVYAKYPNMSHQLCGEMYALSNSISSNFIIGIQQVER
jgi:hypothetical protein